MDAKVFQGLALAGTACLGGAGGRRASASAVTRSTRARRRSFEREVRKLFAAYERKHGITVPWHMSDDQVRAWSDRDSAFAELVEKIDALRREWLG
ncbi:hypothetical protein [Ensifer sp. B1-9]|uniref:hypothetical protein n=1 Tax=Ensifer sp. B1-9 TaxID=3141455 RepID=UPI003D1A1B04